MSTYREGDVLLASVPFDNLEGYKKRPVIVIEIEGNYHLVCCCTTKDKSGKSEGKLIEQDSDENQMFFHFRETTFINYDNRVNLMEEALIKKIGVCPRMIMAEIKAHIELG